MNITLKLFALLFVFIGIIDQILNVLNHYFSPNSFSFHYLFFIIALILFLLSFTYKSKPKPTLWLCENCNIELSRAEIKFGLCPKCHKKIKNFKGMTSYIFGSPDK